jgi:acyl-CoA thioester hydrolase
MSAMSVAAPAFDSPIVCPPQTVEQAWIDYNGHMNMAFYNLVFDRGLDYVYDLLGIGAEYVARGGGSCFTMETHVTYTQELLLGDPIRIHFQLLDCDSKRLHFFQHMYHAEQGYLAATSEQLALHVDLTARRAAALPDDVLTRVEQLLAQHATLPRPEQAGRAVGIRRRS